MKKNPLSILFAGVLFCLTLHVHLLSAQTSFSDNPDLKATTLDQELEKAMHKNSSSPAKKSAVAKVKAKSLPNLFVKTFYAAPAKKSETIASDVLGFTVMHTPSRKMDAEYAVITDFGGDVVKTRYLKGLKTIDDVNDYIQKNMETAEDGNVEIRKLKLPGENGPTFFWVGDKAFNSSEEAKKWIAETRDQVKTIGGNFDEMVSEAQAPAEVEEEYVTQFDVASVSSQKKEEDLVLKWADQMDLGEELWGPFQGDTTGEPLLWQSFGEGSYRKTNLEDNKYHSVVGYWTNRLVFRGIRFPLTTLDPYIETTEAMEAVPENFKSHADFWAGVEWRPLARNHWLENFRPIGDIKLLEWVRNYRFYFQYGERYNLKGPIEAQDWDWQFGTQIFYEFGVELTDLNQPAPETFPEYLKEYVWGEYFADYHYARTDFSTDKNSRAITLGNSLLLGIKLPGIPLPDNPINNEIVLMPYIHLNNTWNDDHSFHYQNYYYVSAGIRWMPFNTWRHKENEWLSKMKIFGEWIAIGKTQYVKQDSTELSNDFVRNDLRVGVSFASRRY